MSKFERIVREPLVMGGQARIRDTGITVNEIVRLSLDGASQAEILQQFSQLEAEDVHEALGWYSGYTRQLSKNIAYEVRTSITAILGYSRLLPLLMPELLTNEQRDFGTEFQTIEANAERVSDCLNDFLEVSTVIELSQLTSEIYTLNWAELYPYLDVKLVDDFKVIAKTSPTNILKYLAVGKLNNYDVPELAKITVEKQDTELRFTVLRQGKLAPYMLEHPSKLAMANLLIYNSGSELKIRQEGNSVIFEFALPIVEA